MSKILRYVIMYDMGRVIVKLFLGTILFLVGIIAVILVIAGLIAHIVSDDDKQYKDIIKDIEAISLKARCEADIIEVKTIRVLRQDEARRKDALSEDENMPAAVFTTSSAKYLYEDYGPDVTVKQPLRDREYVRLATEE
jgi:hypothetical protein